MFQQGDNPFKGFVDASWRDEKTIIIMSKQSTLTLFLKGNKRSITAVSDEVTSKKLKNDDSTSPDVLKSLNGVSPNTNTLWLHRDSPHQIRMELIDWSKKYSIISKNIGLSWYSSILKEEFSKPYFDELNKFVESERRKNDVYPSSEKVWSWTQACKLSDVKVVILGQDPYHTPGIAHGLCFSVQIGFQPPPSLINMYKELENDVDGFKRPGHGYLIGWARQGVLLLNTVLTVTKSQANSHKDKGWENLTDSVIRHLNDNHKGIVFILWGSHAQKKQEFINEKRHYTLKSAHPSPLSASRGFFGCKHFSKCNELLAKDGKTPIDWTQLPTE